MTPALIESLAEGCIRFVTQAVGVSLDGTPDTLPILDHYLALARDDDARSRDEVLGLVATSAGAYFGELVRKQFEGARWSMPDTDDATTWRVEFAHVYLAFQPVAMVQAAILETEKEGGAHLTLSAVDRDAVAASLDRVGEVEEDDYLRLAVRWEVIEQVVAVLESQAAARNESGREYGPASYAAALDAESPRILH
jgi:Family of unknown function (DUF6278)